jgi:hypothetical protein
MADITALETAMTAITTTLADHHTILPSMYPAAFPTRLRPRSRRRSRGGGARQGEAAAAAPAFMLNLMKEFGMKLKKPLVILEDNQSTISG